MPVPLITFALDTLLTISLQILHISDGLSKLKISRANLTYIKSIQEEFLNIILPMNKSDRTRALARRDERFNIVTVNNIADVGRVAFVANSAKVLIWHGRVDAHWTVTNSIEERLNLNIKIQVDDNFIKIEQQTAWFKSITARFFMRLRFEKISLGM